MYLQEIGPKASGKPVLNDCKAALAFAVHTRMFVWMQTKKQIGKGGEI